MCCRQKSWEMMLGEWMMLLTPWRLRRHLPGGPAGWPLGVRPPDFWFTTGGSCREAEIWSAHVAPGVMSAGSELEAADVYTVRGRRKTAKKSTSGRANLHRLRGVCCVGPFAQRLGRICETLLCRDICRSCYRLASTTGQRWTTLLKKHMGGVKKQLAGSCPS